MKQMKQFLIVGLGRFGASVAKTLCEGDVQVMGIDKRIDRVEELRNVVTQIAQVNSTDRDSMLLLDVSAFDVAIVTIGDDIKASCITTMLLKEMGVPYVVAKASDEFHGRMLEKLGADKVVFPERDMGKRVAHNLVSGKLLEYIELSPDFSMAEIRADADWDGKTLLDLRLRNRLGINVVAIRSGGQTNPLPTSKTIVRKGDIMLVVAEEKTLTHFKGNK
ncbi:MAG: TrkA family potassium uptake protein [Christensenellales bacterium]|nr:TrkA family potassium uptake protein [Christensenellales bacterium]